MCRPTPRRWLSALPLCAAIAFAVPAVLSQAPAATPEQTSVQAPDLSIPLIPAEEMSITPAPVSAANLTSPAAQPDRPPTPEELGDSLMARQRYQAAIEAYKKAPQNSPGVWNKMGIAYQLMFNPDQAAHCYQVSLRIKPLDAPVLNNLATIYDSQQHYGDAQRIYRKALKIDPKSALINKNLGTNLLAQHKYKKGWEAYKVAIEIDPNIFKNSVSPRVQNPASIQERGGRVLTWLRSRGGPSWTGASVVTSTGSARPLPTAVRTTRRLSWARFPIASPELNGGSLQPVRSRHTGPAGTSPPRTRLALNPSTPSSVFTGTEQ